MKVKFSKYEFLKAVGNQGGNLDFLIKPRRIACSVVSRAAALRLATEASTDLFLYTQDQTMIRTNAYCTKRPDPLRRIFSRNTHSFEHKLQMAKQCQSPNAICVRLYSARLQE